MSGKTEVKYGDARNLVHELEDESIDCVVTSPPYWNLRDYGHENQIGLEDTPEEYLENMLDLFDEIKVKLKNSGTCFVNLADTYNGNKVGNTDTKNANVNSNDFSKKQCDIPAKSLCMIPERFAWGMIQRGWILRNKIIWHKPNAMPESVKDRFSKTYEYFFFFTKSKKYNFDLDAVRIPQKECSIERYKRADKLGSMTVKGKMHDENYDEKRIGYVKQAPKWFREQKEKKTKRKYDGMNVGGNGSGFKNHSGYYDGNGNLLINPLGKNPGDVWEIENKPYAVAERTKDVVEYRENLPPLNELKEYLKKWRLESRLTIDEIEERFGNQAPHHWFNGESYPSVTDWIKLKKMLSFDEMYDEAMTKIYLKSSEKVNNPVGKNPGDMWQINTKPYKEAHFAVYPVELIEKPILAGCPKGGTVLDPFGGSGTTAEFCRGNDRNCILFELNEEYKPLIVKRAMLNVPTLDEFLTV